MGKFLVSILDYCMSLSIRCLSISVLNDCTSGCRSLRLLHVLYHKFVFVLEDQFVHVAYSEESYVSRTHRNIGTLSPGV